MLNKLQLVEEMQGYFGADQKRINHALKVVQYAEEMLAKEKGNYDVVIAVAVLHDIGIHEAERKYNSSAAKYQEIEGAPIAKGILEKLGAAPETIEEVCQIIAHHHRPGIIKTQNFKILYEADCRVNREEAGLKGS
ncbi:MAG: HD domain-containing protein [Candidatus Saganbacteria bacterium]|nr:HD domain-containing protein [Candidatus Saganbacteria bacterium]